jgi:CubicO group peptidase (beta-lactamase class C family)
LLIIRDGQVFVERYQYDRQPGMPMRSFSMAKTLTSMMVGIALEKGLIRSLDDMVAQYWPEIAESAYGQTSLRNLLRMSSGVRFKELYTWTPDDDNWVWGQVLYLPQNKDQPQKVIEYLNQRTQRDTQAGQRFSYASIETEILGRVLTKATGQTMTQLTQEWLWKPMGAHDRAYWLFSPTDGTESVAGGFNASLRDYGRFGVLLANNGLRDGQSIIPTQYLLDATDATRQPRAFQPRIATPYMGYGYQTWILPSRTRTFALQGIHGQTIYVQPDSKIVMVQTAVYNKASGYQDIWPFRLREALWEGVLQSLGGKVD